MTDLERGPSSGQSPSMRVEPLLNNSPQSYYTGVVERIPSNEADLLMLCTASPSEAATIISDLQADRDALKHDIERHLGIIAELSAEINQLHRSLLFWMPGVDMRLDEATRELAAKDALLLAGYTGPLDGPCWGDGVLERAIAAESSLSRIKSETVERVKDIIVPWTSPATARQRAGEMTAQEVRTVQAILSSILDAIRSLSTDNSGATGGAG